MIYVIPLTSAEDNLKVTRYKMSTYISWYDLSVEETFHFSR